MIDDPDEIIVEIPTDIDVIFVETEGPQGPSGGPGPPGPPGTGDGVASTDDGFF